MEILVKSGGFSPEKDYSWATSSSGESGVRRGDGLLVEFGVSDLYDDRTASVVVARRGGELLLLVSKLDTSHRTDYRGRPIRNMVVWRCDGSEEAELRGLAVLALERAAELAKAVDAAVTRDDQSPSGFAVDWERLSSIRGELIDRASPTVGSCKVARNSEGRRADLAAELKAGPVPQRDGPMVVVTGNVGPDRLADRGVWRGLSSLVTSEEWVVPEKKKTTGSRTPPRGFWTLVIVLGLASVSGLALWSMDWLPGVTNRAPPRASGLVLKQTANQAEGEWSRWSPTDGGMWRIPQPRGATLAVVFESTMDVTSAPQFSVSHPSVHISSAGWTDEGTQYAVQITCEGWEKAENRVFTLRVAGAKDRRGITMVPLEVKVELLGD